MLRSLFCALIVLAGSLTMNASTVTLNFTATVDAVLGAAGVSAGDTITGAITYDTSAVGTYVAAYNYTSYALPTFTVTAGANTFVAAPYSVVRVTDNETIGSTTFDALSFVASSSNKPAGTTYVQYGLTLEDDTANIFNNEALPTAIDIASFGRQSFGLSAYNGQDQVFAFTATINDPNSTPSAVPEPSSIVLLGGGLLGAVGQIRRKLGR